MIKRGAKSDEFTTVVDLAKEVRQYIAKRKKIDWRKTEWHVRCDNNHLKVELTKAPFDMFEEKYFKRWTIFECDSETEGAVKRMVPNKKVSEMLEDIKRLIDQYHFQESEPMCDYFNCNFFYTVKVDDSVNPNFK